MHPTIKVTADMSKTSINFLDVTASIAEGIIETDLYVKSTDNIVYGARMAKFSTNRYFIFQFFECYATLNVKEPLCNKKSSFSAYFKTLHNLHNYNRNKHIK